MLKHAILCSILAGTLSVQSATMIYVSPKGADTNPGTREKPFVTLVRARDEIRALKKAGKLAADGAVVEIAGGRYDIAETFELTAEDSGTAVAPIIYRCDPADRAWLVAGRDVPVSDLKPVTDPDLLARIPETARAHVKCLDLKAAGIHYYLRLPDRFNDSMTRPTAAMGATPENGYDGTKWRPMELFCDGCLLPAARWPNRGFVNIDKVVDEGEGFCTANTRPGTFAQPSLKEKLKLWAGADELILFGYFYRDYYGYSVRVKTIDPENATITLTHGLLDRKSKPHQRFYAHSLPEELDVPGEWYLQRSTGLLCLWPPEGAQTLTFPILTDAIVSLKGASHITMRGLGVEGGRYSAFEVTDGEANRIVACEVRNIGGDGVDLCGQKARDNQVLGCDIHHTGLVGIRLEGGDRRTLTPAGCVAENNYIHHTSRLSVNRAAINFRGVGNRASRNLIHDVPYNAIRYEGNDHIMELNEIFYAMVETNEGGVFYNGRDWTSRGNVIRYNLVHHITGVPDWGVLFVHLDDNSSGNEIYGNICYKCEEGPVICGGHENKIHDNLFVECFSTARIGTRSFTMFESDGKGGFVRDEKTGKGCGTLAQKLIYYKWREPPYSTRYPKLVEVFYKDPIAAPWWNDLERNVAVDCNRHVGAPAKAADWECVVKDNWSGSDPGFVEPDHTKLDFRLKPDAVVYKEIGFHPIPCEKIGVYASPDRASWPVVCERPPTDWKPRWMLQKEARERTPIRVFPVADIKEGRTIVIDGAVNDPEWSPPGYDGAEPNRHGAATIEYLLNGDKDPNPGTAYIETDGKALYVAFVNTVDAAQPVSTTSRWGRDDAVEVSLAVARPPHATGERERPFIFRGYPNGHAEGSIESGWAEPEVARSMQGVEYAAKTVSPTVWTAEFRIPFACFAFDPTGMNRPVLANLTLHRAAGNIWVQWKNEKGNSWELQGGHALWLKPFGAMPYLPGCRQAAARIDIQMEGNPPENSFAAGTGCETPSWSKGRNRIVAEFGAVHGDEWSEFRFQFTSRVDAEAVFELMGKYESTGTQYGAWTYYDDFHVEGVVFTNPDFEEQNPDGTFPGWGFMLEQESKNVGTGAAGIVCPPDGASSGLRVGRANHDNRMTQRLSLRKDQTVTVSFKARAALPIATE